MESAADGSATAEEAKRKVEDGKLHTKRQEIDKAKVSLFLLLVFFVGVIVNIMYAVKRYLYLLGQLELFKHFLEIKLGRPASLGNYC